MCMTYASQCICTDGYTLVSCAYILRLYVPVLTNPCSSTLCVCRQMSLVCMLAKVQDVLEWGEELASHVAMVAGGMVFSPIVG